MKIIKIQAIDPDDQGVRENEILVSRIVGWYTRGRIYSNSNWSNYKGPTTIISIDSGAEYEIAESLENFRERLRAIVDVPVYGWTGFIPAHQASDADVEAINAANEEIRIAKALYDYIRTVDRWHGTRAIIDRFQDLQKEHCKYRHHSECLT